MKRVNGPHVLKNYIMHSFVRVPHKLISLSILVVGLLVFNSCEQECNGALPELVVSNQWDRDIYVEIYEDDYLTQNFILSEYEEMTFIVEGKVKIKTKEANVFFFPDKSSRTIYTRECWEYRITATPFAGNSNQHTLESNDTFR